VFEGTVIPPKIEPRHGKNEINKEPSKLGTESAGTTKSVITNKPASVKSPIASDMLLADREG
jgi:hypothetical protein